MVVEPGFYPRPLDPDDILDEEVLVIDGYSDTQAMGAQGYGTQIALAMD